MVTLEKRLEDPDYKSWVKAALCVQLVKEGLETFADTKSQELHSNVISQIPTIRKICPAACIDPLKNIKKCCHNCQAYMTALESYRSTRAFKFCRDQFNNTEVGNWHTEPWQMAKLFMNRGQAKASIKASETDLSGILNFIDRCRIPLNDVTNQGNIDEVRKERNAILHTSNMSLKEIDFLQKTKPMLDLLNDPKVLATLPAAHDAAERIKKVRENTFKINLDDETLAIKAILAEICSLKDDLSAKVIELEKVREDTIENCKTETEKQQEAIKDVKDGIIKVKQRYEELGVLCNAVQNAHIEDNQQLREKVEHLKSDLNHLYERIFKLDELESRFSRLEVRVREHDLRINELKEESCKLKTHGISEEIIPLDDPDDNQVTAYDFTMRVEEIDDDENSRLRMVRLIKYYPVLKCEMDRPVTDRIAAALLDKDKVGELADKKRRRIAVDMLLKHVLRTEATMPFFNELKEHWKPSGKIQEQLEQLEATEEDVEAYKCIKVHDTSQWNFHDDDRKELRFTIKDFTTIDTVNNWLLARFFFHVTEHDDVIEKLSSNLGNGVDHLFDTMNKCNKCIMRCFCDTLESYCSDICRVVRRLDLRKKYCDPASEVEEDGRFQRFVGGPLRRLFSYCTQLGFTVDRTEVGSLILYLRANTKSAWEELKHKCKSGEIVEMLRSFDTDDQERQTCFEEGDCIRITIYSVKDKSGVPKAILRLDKQDKLVDDGLEANPIKRNMDILCEELEISDSLIEELKGQKLVSDDIIKLLEGQHTRASKIRCLMENISSPEKGFRVLQDYVKSRNTYLFAQLELSTEEYRNTNVFFTCEAMLEAYTSELVDDKLEVNPIKRNMDILCEELEICDSLIEELKEQKLVADNIRKLLEEQRARASKIRCLMENISPPEKGFKALKDYVRRCNTYLFEQLEINSEECRKTVFYTTYMSASGQVKVQWVVKNRKFYDTELKECKLPYTGSHEVMPESNQVPAIKSIHSEDMEHHTKKTLVCPKPGKPVTEDVTSDSVTIHWESQTPLGESNFYHIRYKEKGEKQWEYPERESVTIRNLKANTTYTFQVRAVTYDGEAKFSLEGDEIRTETSMASRLPRLSTKDMPGHPKIYQLRTNKGYAADYYSPFIPSRFEIGHPFPMRDQTEKTILLLSDTRSANTTMVDAMTNYVTGVNFKDPYRVSMVEQKDRFMQIDREERRKYSTANTLLYGCGMETLQYTINPEEGSRLNFRLNILDDQGLDMSLKNALVRAQRFSSELPVHVDAVCILIKAPTDFWSQSQKSVIEQINQERGLFGNINVCTLIMFTDFIKPSIAAMKNTGLTGLLNENCFVFNNNCLFESQTKVSSELWDINNRSFQQFFTWLERISPHYLI